MAKFEIVPLGELKTRLPAKLLPLVEEFKGHLEKLKADQGGRQCPKERDDPKERCPQRSMPRKPEHGDPVMRVRTSIRCDMFRA